MYLLVGSNFPESHKSHGSCPRFSTTSFYHKYDCIFPQSLLFYFSFQSWLNSWKITYLNIQKTFPWDQTEHSWSNVEEGVIHKKQKEVTDKYFLATLALNWTTYFNLLFSFFSLWTFSMVFLTYGMIISNAFDTFSFKVNSLCKHHLLETLQSLKCELVCSELHKLSAVQKQSNLNVTVQSLKHWHISISFNGKRNLLSLIFYFCW